MRRVVRAIRHAVRRQRELLAEMGLARREGDKWLDSMVAGKWHYPARFDGEFFLATIPLISAICCSSTNVDRCDPLPRELPDQVHLRQGRTPTRQRSREQGKDSSMALCIQVVLYKVNHMANESHLFN